MKSVGTRFFAGVAVLLSFSQVGCGSFGKGMYNPSVASKQLPEPRVWLAPIACDNTEATGGSPERLMLSALSHSGSTPATLALSRAACKDLALVESGENKAIEKTWKADEQLARELAVAAGSAKSIAVPVGNWSHCVPGENGQRTVDCQGQNDYRNWAVFIFDPAGNVLFYQRKEVGQMDLTELTSQELSEWSKSMP